MPVQNKSDISSLIEHTNDQSLGEKPALTLEKNVFYFTFVYAMKCPGICLMKCYSSSSLRMCHEDEAQSAI